MGFTFGNTTTGNHRNGKEVIPIHLDSLFGDDSFLASLEVG